MTAGAVSIKLRHGEIPRGGGIKDIVLEVP